MATKIYTKTGDKGETGLFGGARLPKFDLRIESYGTVDELNAHIGYLSELIKGMAIETVLHVVQNKLFNIGSVLAVDPTKDFDMPGVSESDIVLLEKEIDRMNLELPELTAFILPGGNVTAAYAHVARTVCRRAERKTVHLDHIEDDGIDKNIIAYLNRLSDYLFVLARYIVYKNGDEEVLWDSSI